MICVVCSIRNWSFIHSFSNPSFYSSRRLLGFVVFSHAESTYFILPKELWVPLPLRMSGVILRNRVPCFGQNRWCAPSSFQVPTPRDKSLSICVAARCRRNGAPCLVSQRRRSSPTLRERRRGSIHGFYLLLPLIPPSAPLSSPHEVKDFAVFSPYRRLTRYGISSNAFVAEMCRWWQSILLHLTGLCIGICYPVPWFCGQII